MITEKFKQTIFDKLSKDLSHVEIISYRDSFWFINREKKYWYLEFQKSGRLYWRWGFFSNFFQLFSMERDEYEPLITEWVESVLNGGVITTRTNANPNEIEVESVLNGGVITTYFRNSITTIMVESVLNGGVTTTGVGKGTSSFRVESVLNGGVTTTIGMQSKDKRKIDEVLNNTVM
jgi:hypothetical protein